MLGPYVLLGAVAAAAVVSASSFWAGREWERGEVAQRDLAATQATARTAILRADKADRSAEEFEKRRAAVEVRYQNIETEVEHVVTRIEYRNLCFDDDGVRLLNSALAAALAATPGKPASAVRPASATR